MYLFESLNDLLLLKTLVYVLPQWLLHFTYATQHSIWKVTAARTTELSQVCFWLQTEKVSTTVLDNVYSHTLPHTVSLVCHAMSKGMEAILWLLQVKQVMLT